MAQKAKVEDNVYTLKQVNAIVGAYMHEHGDLDTVINTVHIENGHIAGDMNYGLFKAGLLKLKKHTLTVYSFSGKSDWGEHYLVIDMNNYKTAEILVGVDIEADIPKLFAFLKAQYGQLTNAEKVEILKQLLKCY